MSWIVQHLLSNRTSIRFKSNVFEKEYRDSPTLLNLSFDFMGSNIGYNDQQINGDEFNDLLLVERAITELREKMVLSKRDEDIIKFVEDGNTAFSGKNPFKRGPDALIKDFELICERIAFYLGGYFTNDGYIEYMVEEYNLNEKQEKTVRDYIKSRYKHTILRRKHQT